MHVEFYFHPSLRRLPFSELLLRYGVQFQSVTTPTLRLLRLGQEPHLTRQMGLIRYALMRKLPLTSEVADSFSWTTMHSTLNRF